MAQISQGQSPTQADQTVSPSPSPSASTGGPNPRQKRRKIAVACEPCRTRKSRCDGERPVCGPCRSRPSLRHVCAYGKQPPRETSENDASQNALVDRIKNLERLLELSSGITHPQVSTLGARPTPEAPLADEQRIPVHNTTSVSRLNAVEFGQPKSAQVQPPSGTHATRSRSHHDSPSDVLQASSNQSAYSAAIRPEVPFQDSDTRNSVRVPENELSPVNGMGSSSYIDGAGLPSNAFYGGSSMAFFMKQVRETIPNQPSEDPPHLPITKQQRQSNSLNHSNFSLGTSNQDDIQQDIELPSRDLADQLIEVYWTRSHILYPYICKSTFMQAYEDLWKPQGHIRVAPDSLVDHGLGSLGIADSRSAVFHCALNSIFALACQLYDTNMGGKDRHSLSDTFFLRSKKLLHIDIFNSGNLAFVQTLLVMTQYLQSTSFPSRCWNALGFACRIAQGLGLHVELPRSTRSDSEVETRRRTWHGCVIMDIVTGMTLGRPTMTPVHILIPQPSVLEEDRLPIPSETATHFADQPTTISFYIESIKLYSILSKILANVYKPWSGTTTTFSQDTMDGHSKKASDSQIDVRTLLSLDEEMSVFEESITPWLHWKRGVEMRSSMPYHARKTLERQSVVLFTRYQHVRLLLNRPCFLRIYHKLVVSNQAGTRPVNSASMAFNTSRTHLDSLEIQASIACIDAATVMIRTLNESIMSMSYSTWWYATFYIYTAGMVLLLAESCTPMHEYFGLAEIEESWRVCCDTLRHLTQINASVHHALHGLITMQQKLAPRASTRPRNVPSSGDRTESASSGHPAPINDIRDDGRWPNAQNETSGDGRRLADSQQDTGNPPGIGTNDFNEVLFGQSSSAQPWIDFILQDMDMMPLDQSDDVWWRQ